MSKRKVIETERDEKCAEDDGKTHQLDITKRAAALVAPFMFVDILFLECEYSIHRYFFNETMEF